ncbi:MAG: ABC transporter permease subunit [Acidobacteriota bacterium]
MSRWWTLFVLLRRDLLSGRRQSYFRWGRVALALTGALFAGITLVELEGARFGNHGVIVERGWQLLTLLAGCSTLLAFALTSDAVAGERRRGTLSLLLSSGFTPTTLVLGRFLSGFAVLSILLVDALPGLAVFAWFGTPRPDELALAILAFGCWNAAVLGLGLAVSARARRPLDGLLLHVVLVGVLVGIGHLDRLVLVTPWAAWRAAPQGRGFGVAHQLLGNGVLLALATLGILLAVYWVRARPRGQALESERNRPRRSRGPLAATVPFATAASQAGLLAGLGLLELGFPSIGYRLGNLSILLGAVVLVAAWKVGSVQGRWRTPAHLVYAVFVLLAVQVLIVNSTDGIDTFVVISLATAGLIALFVAWASIHVARQDGYLDCALATSTRPRHLLVGIVGNALRSAWLPWSLGVALGVLNLATTPGTGVVRGALILIAAPIVPAVVGLLGGLVTRTSLGVVLPLFLHALLPVGLAPLATQGEVPWPLLLLCLATAAWLWTQRLGPLSLIGSITASWMLTFGILRRLLDDAISWQSVSALDITMVFLLPGHLGDHAFRLVVTSSLALAGLLPTLLISSGFLVNPNRWLGRAR